MTPLRDDAREILDSLPLMIWMAKDDGAAAYGNRSWRDYTGMKHDGPRSNESWLERVHPDEYSAALSLWSGLRKTDTPYELECRLRDRSGEYRWFFAVLMEQRDEDGAIKARYATFMDTHARVLRDAARSNSMLAQGSMLDASIDCIKIIETDGSLRHMNKSGCTALGLPEENPQFGMKWLPLLPRDVHRRGQRALEAARKGKKARFAGLSVLPGQRPQHWDNILTPMKNGADTTGILCVSRNVTAQRQAENRLRIASEIDALTGLTNRRTFNIRLAKTLAKALEKEASIGLMLIDLDHFKHVNDTLGHAAGDHLLRILARRLKSCLPENGFVARLGSDEFAVVLSDIGNEDDLIRTAKRVHRQMDAPITYGGMAINCGMSIGCAIFPRDAGDASSLMKSADTALEDLKTGDRGGIRLFDTPMAEAVERKLSQLSTARQIIRDRLIEPRYQPKVRLKDRSIFGFEALMRWRSPETGELREPGAVAEAFNDYELATQIADIMQDKVLEAIASWLERGLHPLPVSINAAPVEFLRNDFAERFLDKMERFQVPHFLVEIEIAEHVLVERGAEFVTRALRLLKNAGVRIALDDFGTGHSSLARLTEYPVDCLKIDRSFVDGMLNETSTLAVVETIVKLGPSLSLDVVAEGIEDEQQRDILVRAGLTLGQGFLFSEALDGERVVEIIS